MFLHNMASSLGFVFNSYLRVDGVEFEFIPTFHRSICDIHTCIKK